MGRIWPSKLPQASPFFFVKKKDSKLHPVQEYQYLNEHTVTNTYPLPLITDLINNLQHFSCFMKFDVHWGYNNIHIKEGDEWKAAFITQLGLFKPTIMFFGLHGSPPTFQAFMYHNFTDYIREGWLVIYMDHLAISANSEQDEEWKVHLILQWFHDLGLSLKLSKCDFSKMEVEFLGMIVGCGCIRMDPAKLSAIMAWPPLKTVKAVQSFLGFCNFYRRFIPSFSTTATPLTALTRKHQPWTWGLDQQTAFNLLLSQFQTALVLQLSNVRHLFIVMTDTSLSASGGVLMQKNDNGDLHPCAYLSQMFTAAERNYNIYDWELLAIIHALDHWCHYLQGTSHPVTLLTDHKNLMYFHQPQKLSRCQACWMMFLQDFDLHFVHIPGTAMGPADALSRLVDPDVSSDNNNVTLLSDDLFIHIIDTALVNKITSSTPSDPLVLDALHNLSVGSPLFPCSSLANWHFSGSCLYFKNCLYIPPNACCDLLASVHSSLASSHGGFFRTYSLLSQDYWWPGMSSFIRCYVSGCTLCQHIKVNTHLTVPALSPIPSSCTRPFQQLSVDLVTDLPPSFSYDSLMVMVDHGLSKGVILISCAKTIDAKGVAELFFKNGFLQFRLHDHLISDWGPQFASAFTTELAHILGYDLKLSTMYHLQMDGEMEWVNQEVETYLRMLCQGQPDKWSELIPMAEFMHNSATHSSTQKSLFSLILGYEPRDYPKIGQIFLPSLEDRLTLLKQARNEALAAHEKAWQSMREQITTKFIPWKVGDKVWLEGKNLRLHYPTKKLAPKWEGPFEISQVISPLAYHLWLPLTWKIHDIFHASLLSINQETAEHRWNFINPPPEEIEGEEEYEVAEILSHRGSPGQRMYLVSWKGYSSTENTWEPEKNLWHAQMILKSYKQWNGL